MSVLARRQVRTVAVGIVSAITGVAVESPGDWALPPSKLPSIRLRVSNERKASIAKTMPEFTTTVTLEIVATLQALSGPAAQDAIELLGAQIEDALFGAQPLVRLCQQFSGVTTETDISADGEQHVARIRMLVDCEVFEAFDPTAISPADYPALEQLVAHADLGRPFDATGTYPNPPFPAAVAPAPRTAGPDGRDEALLQINFS